MQYVAFSSIRNLKWHDRTGGPFVEGVCLVPVPPAVITSFQAISMSSVRVLDAVAVERHCLEIAASASAAAKSFADDLARQESRCRAYIPEAQRLADCPIAGTEADAIAGMIAAVDGVLATSDPDLSTADFLKAHLSLAVGIDTIKIEAALQGAQDELAKGALAKAGLIAISQELVRLHELATSPASLDRARSKRVSAKASRAIEPSLTELKQAHARATQLVEELHTILSRLEAVT